MSKIPYFRVFPLYGGMICHIIVFSKFQVTYVFCAQNFIASTLFKDQILDIYSGGIRGNPKKATLDFK